MLGYDNILKVYIADETDIIRWKVVSESVRNVNNVRNQHYKDESPYLWTEESMHLWTA